MYQIRIEFTFDSGHRLLDYNGKCAYPHGHTYRAEVFIESQSLNDLGLVYDFTDLKDKIKTWVDENWDHAFLVNSQDSELIAGLGSASLVRLYEFQDENPSCEVMSRVLYEKTVALCNLVPAKVRLWESVNQYAEFSGD
ncbi:MAG TPA: 6-carboxytetrahydropterin synthase [Dehalococcoidia bacterium]|jgi:6-pyruvoyltetrahydropterin/6-carboxytetrahydropterin synthase|nr:6-carboxytetrahydropterin synthase [Dehalococcoidia bacterium]HIL31442.1 6-carboxytetrahydropterin synthase [Dehalococcoidia bacterium]